MQSIEVVLVDDSPHYVAAVKAWLEVCPEVNIVGVAGSGEEACRLVEAVHPDLVLIDVAMPGISGFETVSRICRMADPPKIIMLTISEESSARRAALSAGADDFVAKTELTTKLLPAIARLFPETPAVSSGLSATGAVLSAQVVNVAPMLVVSVAVDGTVLFANKAVTDIAGLAATDLVGQNVWRLVRRPEKPESLDEWLGCSVIAEPLELDMTLVMRSGETRLISWRLSKTRNTRGEVAEILLVGADVTGRAWIERVLQRFAHDVSGATGARFFELLAEYIGAQLGFDVVVVGELLHNEPERIASIAVWPQPVVAHPFIRHLSGTPCERVAHGEFLTYAEGVREAFPCADRIQELQFDSYVGAPLVGSDGHVIGVICGFGRGPIANQAVAEMMFRILAGRAAAELERELARRDLERSEALFRGLIEQTQDVVALLDTNDAFTYVSPAVEGWLGYRPADCVGVKVIDMVHPMDRPKIEGLLLNPYPSRPECLIEARIRHADGSWRSMESTIAERVDAEGQRFRVITARDLTARRRLEDHLRQAQKTEIIGRLATGVAHDFGNILMVIRSHTDILTTRTDAEDPRHKFVEAIREAVTRGAGLVGQLVAFNRQREFTPANIDLNASIERMTVLLRRLVGKTIKVVSNLSPAVGTIVADATQIEQVILNLIINARDAMPDGGQITIDTAEVTEVDLPPGVELPAGDYVRLSVADTGCGISDEVKAHIFDPLFTTKPEGRGTGLGLATVKGIVARHGGLILVHSQVGVGSTFRIFLPRLPPGVPPMK